MDGQPILEDASLLCYRIFDIASEIDLEKARRLVAEETRRLRLSRAGSEYLLMPSPPLGIELGKRTLTLSSGTYEVDGSVRLFDHGAASVMLTLPVRPGTSLEALIPLADELYDSQAVEKLSLELIEGLRRTMALAIIDPHLWEQNESYTIVFARKVRGDPSASDLLKADLGRLLLGEKDQKLSVRERADVTQHAFSYSETDLAVVDWNSAFVYEPSGSSDIPTVLEICNAQLLELRYYDDQLDRHIRETYDSMQRHARRPALFANPYKPLARRVLLTLLDLSELIERVENSLKIIGDFYLAKVYEAALHRLRVRAWQATVTRKQQIFQNVYELIKGEVDASRSFTLEATVVILIVSEIVLAIASLKR